MSDGFSEAPGTRETVAHRNDSESVVHRTKVNSWYLGNQYKSLHKERNSNTGQELDHDSWIPECTRNYISSNISKMVDETVRHCDQDERNHDGAVHWDTMYTKLLREFQDQVGRNCAHTKIGFITFISAATRRGSSIAKTQEEDWRIFEQSRSIQVG